MAALDKHNQTFKKAMPWRLFARKMHKIHHAETWFPNISYQNHSRNQSTQSRSHFFRPVTTLDNTPPSSRMQRRPRNSFRAKGQPWGPTFSRKATVEPGMLWPLSLLEKRWKTPSPSIPFHPLPSPSIPFHPLPSPSRPPTKIIGGSEL